MRKKCIHALMVVCVLLSACNQNENNNGNTVINIAKTAEEYGVIPYGEFKERTGNEAEFYHGERFIAEIPDSSLCVIYIGEYDKRLLISLDESIEETVSPESVAWLEII